MALRTDERRANRGHQLHSTQGALSPSRTEFGWSRCRKLRDEALLGVLLEQSCADSERLREWATHLLADVGDDRARERLEAVASDGTEPQVVRSTAARALDAHPGTFRRQFIGGTENQSTDLPGESTPNRRPDL